MTDKNKNVEYTQQFAFRLDIVCIRYGYMIIT